jgi:allose kinase
MKIFGMDIGGTNVRSGFVSIDKNGVAAAAQHFRIGKSAEIFGDDVQGAVSKFLEYIGKMLETEKPVAISLGAPSTVDQNNRIIYSTPNIRGLDNVPIADMVEKEYGIPCFVNKDVCLLLLYDIHVHMLKRHGFILGFYIGTGLGNAICYNGELVTGRHGVAAELGHIPVQGKNDLCGCGSRGCIELYASGKRLSQIRDQNYPNLSIGDVFNHYGDDPVIAEFIDNMGVAIATEITILDPEEIILGGGVILQEGFPRKKLEVAIRCFARKPYPAKDLEFIYSSESQENGVIGAGLFAYHKLGDKQ